VDYRFCIESAEHVW